MVEEFFKNMLFLEDTIESFSASLFAAGARQSFEGITSFSDKCLVQTIIGVLLARFRYLPQLKARQSATPAAPAVRAVLPNRTWRKIKL